MNRTHTFSIVTTVRLEQVGQHVEVWRGEELLATVTSDEDTHFALFRVLNRLAQPTVVAATNS